MARKKTTKSSADSTSPDIVIITGLSGSGMSSATNAFQDLGYFCIDRDSAPGRLVFNRTVSLRDTWAKVQQKSAR